MVDQIMKLYRKGYKKCLFFETDADKLFTENRTTNNVGFILSYGYDWFLCKD